MMMGINAYFVTEKVLIAACRMFGTAVRLSRPFFSLTVKLDFSSFQ
jgi:hypothetical protein